LATKTNLSLKYLGINTHKDPIVYMRADCIICKSERFNAQSRVMIKLNQCSIIATLNIVETDLFKIHAETQGQLHYALDFFKEGHDIFQIEENI